MRSAVRSWLRRTDRYWDSLLGRTPAAARPAARSRQGRRTPPRLSLEGLEGREAPSESLASLGAPVGLGLAWTPFPDDLADRPAATAVASHARTADDSEADRRKPRWDDLIDLTTAPARPVRAAPASESDTTPRRQTGDDPSSAWPAGVGVRPPAQWVGAGQVSAASQAVASPPAGAPPTTGGTATTTTVAGDFAPSVGMPAAPVAPFSLASASTASEAPSTAAASPAFSTAPAAAPESSLLHPAYVLDANKGAVLTEAAPNRDFAGWAADLKAQVSGAAVLSYSWDLSGAPDATGATGTDTYHLQFTWGSFTGPARSETISLTTTFVGGGSQTQTFTFRVDGTDSPAWTSTPPTGSSSFPAVTTEDVLFGEGSVTGPTYALGLASGKATTTHTLPTYNPDVPALSFVYASTAADARPIVRVRYALPDTAAVPATVTAQLTFNGVTYDPVVYDTTGMNPGDVLEFALQADATGLPTGRYDYSVAVTGPSGGGVIGGDGGLDGATADGATAGDIGGGGGTTTTTYAGRVDVVNDAGSAFGAGWSLAGLNRLWAVSDGLVVEQAGGVSQFRPAPPPPPPGGGFQDLSVSFEDGPGDFTDLVRNEDGTYTQTLTDGTRINYSAAGLQTSVVDRDGNTTSYGYDASNRLTSITDRHGLATTLAYDANGKLASVTDPAGRTTGFTVTAGKLTTITDADTHSWSYGYDTAGKLTSITDPTSRQTVIAYGAGGRAASATWGTGATEYLTPQAVVGLAVPPQGTSSNPAPAVLAAASTAVHTDGRGYDWTYRFDWSGFGSTARADAPDGGVSVAFHDPNDLTWLSADPLGRRARAYFDDKGNATEAVNPDDTYSTATYNGFAEPLTATDELGHTTTYGYNANGDLTSITDPLGKVTTQTVNPDGTVATRTDPLGHTVTFGYDARGRLVSQTDSLNHTTTYGYDTKGNRTTVTDSLNHTTTTAYDAMNRVTSVTDAQGGVTSYTYDAAGRTLTVTDPDNNTTTYTYSTAVDKVATETDPLGHVTAYAYDGEGDLTAVTDRDGRVREFSYDPTGRKTGEVWRDTVGGPAVYTGSLSYDLAGEVQSVADNYSSYAYTYDARGRVRTEDDAGTPGLPHVVLTYGYDAKGDLTSVSDNLGTAVAYSYTVRDQLAGASLSVNGVLGPNASFGYDDAGRLTSETRQDGTTGPTVGTAFGYDDVNRLTSIAHTSSAAGSLSSFAYGYDAADRLTSYSGPDGTLAYAYDDTNQLTGVSGSATESFAYDGNGNRAGGGYATGAGNRLTSDGTYNYTYDAEGNRLTKTRISDGQVTSYTYDERNRLTEVQVRSAGGVLLADERYTYDALNRRIAVLTDPDGAGPQPAARLWTAYRGDNAWADFDGSGTLQTRYLFGLGMDSLIARANTAGAVGWYLTDAVGSVRQIVATGGGVLYAASYTAFGQVRSSTGTGGDRFGFTGREFSTVTGDWYYRARYYDAGTGRFLGQDPLRFGGGDTNLYRYVGNVPTGATDPTGLRGFREWWSETWIANIGAAGDGIVDGAAMFANAATFHQIDSLNNYVNRTIAENGGAYQAANVSMHVGAYALEAAGALYIAGAAGAPTAGVGVTGTSTAEGCANVHVSWGIATRGGSIVWRGGYRDGVFVERAFSTPGYWNSLTGIPVLNSAAVAEAPLVSCFGRGICLTTAVNAILRGWRVW
jgi:RHS repeat-associated protein